MREPSTQTKFLASAPAFFGSWGLGIWSLYQLSQQDAAWPLALGSVIAIATVTKADNQMASWKAWQAEWDALGPSPLPHQRYLPGLALLIGLPLFALLASLLIDAGKHGGGQAVTGVLMLLVVPLLSAIAIRTLWRRARSRRRAQTSRTKPVTVCIRRAIVPVLPLDAAYRALPPYCQQLLGRTS